MLQQQVCTVQLQNPNRQIHGHTGGMICGNHAGMHRTQAQGEGSRKHLQKNRAEQHHLFRASASVCAVPGATLLGGGGTLEGPNSGVSLCVWGRAAALGHETVDQQIKMG